VRWNETISRKGKSVHHFLFLCNSVSASNGYRSRSEASILRADRAASSVPELNFSKALKFQQFS